MLTSSDRGGTCEKAPRRHRTQQRPDDDAPGSIGVAAHSATPSGSGRGVAVLRTRTAIILTVATTGMAWRKRGWPPTARSGRATTARA